MKSLVALALLACSAFGEVRTMTLRQALDIALQQNPDILLARLDQQRARHEVVHARDAFIPKISGGTGAAYTHGFPTSIDGAAPSIFQARTQMALFNRPQSYQLAQANEAIRGAEIDVASKQDEAVYRVATLFLDAERAARSLTTAERQIESLIRMQSLMDSRIGEGRELPIEGRKAALAVARARQSVANLTSDLINAEIALAEALGLPPDDRIRAQPEERAAIALPTEESSVERALETSKELKRLESDLQVKILEVKQHQAERLPKINLVAQYNLLAKYNNYEQFFNRFQYNNFQFGASFELPILSGRSSSAAASQAELDASKIRLEVSRTRTKITANLRRAFQEVRRAESARDLARADLDLAREQINVDLAQFDEGRLPMARVEEARATEQEKWLAYYGSQHALERARLDVLHQSGGLLAALR
jgi:outer membrane protein TolC